MLSVAEAKWTTKLLDASVLASVVEHKLPAMAQAGYDITAAEIILASRSGFTDGVRALALEHPKVALLDAQALLR